MVGVDSCGHWQDLGPIVRVLFFLSLVGASYPSALPPSGGSQLACRQWVAEWVSLPVTLGTSGPAQDLPLPVGRPETPLSPCVVDPESPAREVETWPLLEETALQAGACLTWR